MPDRRGITRTGTLFHCWPVERKAEDFLGQSLGISLTTSIKRSGCATFQHSAERMTHSQSAQCPSGNTGDRVGDAWVRCILTSAVFVPLRGLL
jgi:hypothetical protein